MPAWCSLSTAMRDVLETGAAEVARLGREEGEGVVAPVVRQAALDEVPVLREGLDRHELDRGDAEPLEIGDHGRRRDRREGSPDVFSKEGVAHGQSADMRLVDDGPRPGVAGMAGGDQRHRVEDARLRDEWRAVALVLDEIGVVARADRVAVQRIVPDELADELAAIGIEQELAVVEAMSLARRPRPGDAPAIDLAPADAGKVAVPDAVRAFAQAGSARSPAAPCASNRHSVTPSALSENSAKLAPVSSGVAPRG